MHRLSRVDLLEMESLSCLAKAGVVRQLPVVPVGRLDAPQRGCVAGTHPGVLAAQLFLVEPTVPAQGLGAPHKQVDCHGISLAEVRVSLDLLGRKAMYLGCAGVYRAPRLEFLVVGEGLPNSAQPDYPHGDDFTEIFGLISACPGGGLNVNDTNVWLLGPRAGTPGPRALSLGPGPVAPPLDHPGSDNKGGMLVLLMSVAILPMPIRFGAESAAPALVHIYIF